MSNKKKKEAEAKSRLWYIYNQEEQAVAVSYAKSNSGALAKFEQASGLDRASYRAEECNFTNWCALTPMVYS
jgi:hypothetical protein